MSALRKVVASRNSSIDVNFDSNRFSAESIQPLSWQEYFEKKETVELNSGSFVIYRRGSGDSAILLIHGGGYSALSWSCFAREMTNLHADITCYAIDVRGHGNTELHDDSMDMSLSTLSNDVDQVIESLFAGKEAKILLVGHSMGGSIAVEVASLNSSNLIWGVVVLDVVEGTAMKSLDAMSRYVISIPSSFPSLSEAIKWSLSNDKVRNIESARVSVPGQLCMKGSAASSEGAIKQSGKECDASSQFATSWNTSPSFKDCEESQAYYWRVDLLSTRPYWEGWFKGMSKKFLSCPVAKLLLLAGMHSLGLSDEI